MLSKKQVPEFAATHSPNLFERAANIQLVVMDVDGVLTRGGLTYDSAGNECKTFNVKDGLGITLGIRSGLQFGIITARTSQMIERRVQDLGIQHVIQGMKTKLPGFEKLAADCGLSFSQMAFIGDDLPDIPPMQIVGLACCPADAAWNVQQIAHLKSEARGGDGAVRELLEFILDCRTLKLKNNV
jgi:3-deoxy-D-manno-octulosonate 8-phosphate phosphatase (KDO 8-P phosphatase)